MSDPNVNAFRLRFPEFADKSDPLIAFALEEAGLIIGTLGDSRRPLALLYMAGHIISSGKVSSENQGASGGVISDSIGRISQTVSDTSTRSEQTDVPDLKTTYYGRRYLSIMKIGQSPLQVLSC